jgi:hypothetical protein
MRQDNVLKFFPVLDPRGRHQPNQAARPFRMIEIDGSKIVFGLPVPAFVADHQSAAFLLVLSFPPVGGQKTAWIKAGSQLFSGVVHPQASHISCFREWDGL